MPYRLQWFKKGYKVRNKETKKDYSKDPIPKEKAIKQKRLLEMISGKKGEKK
jgi:hypothetical protein